MDPKRQAAHQELVDKVIQQIQEGKPFFWDPGHNQKIINGSTNVAYRGGNIVRLSIAAMERGYSDPRWVTYKQAKDNGWHVRKDEHGVKIEVYQQYTGSKKKKEEEDEKEDVKSPSLRIGQRYRVATPTVFNAEQVEGMPPLPELSKEHREQLEKERVEAIETIIAHSEAPVHYDQLVRNYYSPSEDAIHVMQKEKFHHADRFYSTVLHEIGHTTGHESRLDRDMTGSFGTESYAKEELRAELTSMFLNQEFNMQFDKDHFKEHAAYLQSWAKVLKDDPEELFRAAADAEKAADYIRTNMLEKYLTKDKAQEKSAEHTVTLSQLENMDQKELNRYGEQLKARRDWEIWQATDKMPPEIAREYTNRLQEEDWLSQRNSAGAIWEKAVLPLEVDSNNSKATDVKNQISKAGWLLQAQKNQQRMADLKEAYPIRPGELYVEIRYSEELPGENKEKPYDWDKPVQLSIAAAEHLFKEADAKRYLSNTLSGYEHTYGKTDFYIKDPNMQCDEITKPYEDRYDLGCLNGGLVQHVLSQRTKIGPKLEQTYKEQEKEFGKYVIKEKPKEFNTYPQIGIKEAFVLANQDRPVKPHNPTITMQYGNGKPEAYTLDLEAGYKAMRYLKNRQDVWNAMAGFRDGGRKENVDIAYTIQKDGELMYKGQYSLGKEKDSFKMHVYLKSEIGHALQKDKVVGKTPEERPRHNISRTIELKPKKRRKVVSRRKTTATKDRGR